VETLTVVEEPQAGSSFIRPDGKEKVTGAGRYTADVSVTGQSYAKFRYADHTHARIIRIDASQARALPGVFAVLTHEDVPDVLYGGMVKDRRLFAKDTVRFEGDIVAGVAALTSEIAEQAAALIEVEYEVLPVVTDFEVALAEDAPLVHPEWESYEADEALLRNRNTLGYSTIVSGDVDAALADADVVVRGRYVTAPVQGCRSSRAR
jgi:carbon-monoxide dehydrogenase large subunit